MRLKCKSDLVFVQGSANFLLLVIVVCAVEKSSFAQFQQWLTTCEV